MKRDFLSRGVSLRWLDQPEMLASGSGRAPCDAVFDAESHHRAFGAGLGQRDSARQGDVGWRRGIRRGWRCGRAAGRSGSRGRGRRRSWRGVCGTRLRNCRDLHSGWRRSSRSKKPPHPAGAIAPSTFPREGGREDGRGTAPHVLLPSWEKVADTTTCRPDEGAPGQRSVIVGTARH